MIERLYRKLGSKIMDFNILIKDNEAAVPIS